MKISLHSVENCSNAVLHLSLSAAILAGIIATGCGPQTTTQVQPTPQSPQTPFSPQPAPAPSAASSSILGQWRATLPSGTVTLAILNTGQYDQTGVGTTGVQTMQAGPYQLTAPNTIAFSVTDWSPKTKWIYVPNPTCGVPGVPNPTNPRRDSCRTEQEWTMPQPPGSRYAYSFNGPNSMILNNEAAQETITFTRLAQ
jgi:hypothetical protein